MIFDLKTREGYVYAYVVWYVVDEAGDFNKDGFNIFIEEMWIHSNYRRKNVMKDLARMIFFDNQSQKTEFVKYKKRKTGEIKAYLISKFFKLMGVSHGW